MLFQPIILNGSLYKLNQWVYFCLLIQIFVIFFSFITLTYYILGWGILSVRKYFTDLWHKIFSFKYMNVYCAIFN